MKVAMTWAYSPSYGKPLSVPQGVIGLFTRFGMDVTLAHPEGYDVMPEVEEVAKAKGLEDGFRVISNKGVNAGQTVMHFHMHVLGGKNLGENLI